jgi:pimeloyl-ACP methyl ester carboxylesterase
MTAPTDFGYAPANGVEMYWESRGDGGVPLIVTHGGFGQASTFGALLDELAKRRRVIAIELQGHGHTADIDRPFTFEAFGDDIAALSEALELGRADLLGRSLGAGATLRAAIQHPDLIRSFALLSFPCRRDGWLPDVLGGMSHVNSSLFEQMSRSTLYADWLAVAPDPDPDIFRTLMDRTGALLARPFDWSEEVAALPMPLLLVYGDADSIAPAHAAEFFALLGGGARDAGWDDEQRPTQSQLAILPKANHYDIVEAPGLAGVLDRFFG